MIVIVSRRFLDVGDKPVDVTFASCDAVFITAGKERREVISFRIRLADLSDSVNIPSVGFLLDPEKSTAGA